MNADEVWTCFQRGLNYKSGMGLYETVHRNERFFVGDQWAGVNVPDLPKPVVNFIKRACQQKIAEVNANPVRVSFSVRELEEGSEPPGDEEALLLGELFGADWERMKLDSLILDGLQDACITGDCILYLYWDADAETGLSVKGEMRAELIDSLNFYPADPAQRELQRQPFILLA